MHAAVLVSLAVLLKVQDPWAFACMVAHFSGISLVFFRARKGTATPVLEVFQQILYKWRGVTRDEIACKELQRQIEAGRELLARELQADQRGLDKPAEPRHECPEGCSIIRLSKKKKSDGPVTLLPMLWLLKLAADDLPNTARDV